MWARLAALKTTTHCPERGTEDPAGDRVRLPACQPVSGRMVGSSASRENATETESPSRQPVSQTVTPGQLRLKPPTLKGQRPPPRSGVAPHISARYHYEF